MESDTRWPASAWLLLLLLCHLVISALTEQQGSAPEWKKFFLSQRTTFVNDSTKLFCKVKGTPRPFIEWFKNGEALADGNRVRITKYALEVKNTQLSDAGEYACRASNQHGVLWGNMTLRVLKEIEDATPPFEHDDNDDSDPFSSVLSEPVWKWRKGPASYISGSATKTVELDCDVRGFPEPNITWYKVDGGKRALLDLTKSKYVVNNRWKLKIDDLALEDKGQYMCIVANIVGAINWTFTVDVLQRLRVLPIVDEIDNKTAIEGDTVRFTCKIILSDSQPFLQWFQHYKINDSYVDKKGTPNVKLLQQSGYTKTIDDPQNLVLHNVSRKDEGWYTCLVTNAIGMNYKSAYLAVMTAITCKPLRPTPYGHWIIPVSQILPGTNAWLVCQTGYHVDGDAKVTCTSSGEWESRDKYLRVCLPDITSSGTGGRTALVILVVMLSLSFFGIFARAYQIVRLKRANRRENSRTSNNHTVADPAEEQLVSQVGNHIMGDVTRNVETAYADSATSGNQDSPCPLPIQETENLQTATKCVN